MCVYLFKSVCVLKKIIWMSVLRFVIETKSANVCKDI